MSYYAQPAALAATAIVSLAIGFAASTWIASRNHDDTPIINSSAWEETTPVEQTGRIQTVSLTNAVANASNPVPANCNPWEVSDIAMEEVLDQMIRRGWRPPYQGEAIASMGVSNIAAAEPNAPMPYRRTWAPEAENAIATAIPAETAVDVVAQPAVAPVIPAAAPSGGAAAQPVVAIDQPPG